MTAMVIESNNKTKTILLDLEELGLYTTLDELSEEVKNVENGENIFIVKNNILENINVENISKNVVVENGKRHLYYAIDVDEDVTEIKVLGEHLIIT